MKKSKLFQFAGLVLLLAVYVGYVAFIIHNDRGPVDYETFMSIGKRFLQGGEVYGENSYYPMPFVMLFGAFAWLPRPLSMALWLLLPVLAALAISGWQPWVLLYAPVFGHFLGGQTAVFGMLGLWGYRRRSDPENPWGGFWLGVACLKPQLGLVMLAYAAWQWLGVLRRQRRLPRQAWAWLATLLGFYLPGFLFLPDWPLRWLRNPRPLFDRAMSGFIPRSLLWVFDWHSWAYWLAWLAFSGLLLWLAWRLSQRRLGLDVLVLWSFVCNPLVHDYDLVQLVPLLDTPRMQRAAVLLGLAGLLVIAFAYANDQAWYVYTIIAPGLLAVKLIQLRPVVREELEADENGESC
jgi:hypothetical protein